MPAFAQNLFTMTKHKYLKHTFKPYEIDREISGEHYRFYIADPVAKEWYDTTSTVWPEMDFLKEHLIVPGDVILECGAHHGITTCHFSKSTGPKGQVVAFEPSPFNVTVIEKNLKLNHLRNVKVVNKAIGDKPGKAHFSFVSNASIQKGAAGTFEIDVTTIDTYADLKPTMLKIDVEGYDVEALQGAKQVLKTRPKIALEIHTTQLPNFGHTVQDIFDLLDLTDYKCTIMGEGKFRPLGKVSDITTNVHLFAVPKNSAK